LIRAVPRRVRRLAEDDDRLVFLYLESILLNRFGRNLQAKPVWLHLRLKL
jgi:hypothetical protein